MSPPAGPSSTSRHRSSRRCGHSPVPLVADGLLPDSRHQRLHDRARHDLDRVVALFDRSGDFAHSLRARVVVADPEDDRRAGDGQRARAARPGASYVFASNHQSIYDIPILFASLPFQLRIIAKASLGSFPLLGWHLQRTGHLFVESQEPGRRHRREDGRLVSESHSLIIFPEGTGASTAGSAGSRRAASSSRSRRGLPVVPVSVIGSAPGDAEGPADGPSRATCASSSTIRFRRRRDARDRSSSSAIASATSCAAASTNRPARGCDAPRDADRCGDAIIERLPSTRDWNRHEHDARHSHHRGRRRGLRLGAGVPKQLLEVGADVDPRAQRRRVRGRIRTWTRSSSCVAAPSSRRSAAVPAAARLGASASSPAAHGARIRWPMRSRPSTRSTEVVLIHDAARPFVDRRPDHPHDSRGRSNTARRSRRCRSRDTVKRGRRGRRQPAIVETIPRESIFLAQTPQAFRRDVLRDAIALGRVRRRGDRRGGARRARRPRRARRRRRAGRTSRSRRADDLARSAAAHRAPNAIRITARRVGTGYDLHRLVEGRPLVLGGVEIPSERGALGHSDADVVCHAVTDAILGAACARRHRPSFSGHRSALEGRVEPRSAAPGGSRWCARPGSRSSTWTSTVILERPKIAPTPAAMRARLAARAGDRGGARQRQGQDQRGRRRRRPRRGDRRARGGAAGAPPMAAACSLEP